MCFPLFHQPKCQTQLVNVETTWPLLSWWLALGMGLHFVDGRVTSQKMNSLQSTNVGILWLKQQRKLWGIKWVVGQTCGLTSEIHNSLSAGKKHCRGFHNNTKESMVLLWVCASEWAWYAGPVSSPRPWFTLAQWKGKAVNMPATMTISSPYWWQKIYQAQLGCYSWPLSQTQLLIRAAEPQLSCTFQNHWRYRHSVKLQGTHSRTKSSKTIPTWVPPKK